MQRQFKERQETTRRLWLSVLGIMLVLSAIAWIFLAAPNSGWFNKAAVALTGAQKGPFNIYSVPGAILVIALYSYPYAFTFVARAALPASSSVTA